MGIYAESDLAAVLVPEGGGAHLPTSAYLDETVALYEAQHLWAAGWVCVASAAHLARRGDHLARLVGEARVVICRDGTGRLQAFHNVCQHRGCQLVDDGSHSRPRMVCPYHAWIYNHDGALERAPHSDVLDRADRARFDLVPVRTEVLHGLVFVDLSGRAGPLVDELGPLGVMLGEYGVGALKMGARIVEEVEANWKVVAENSLECNHCPVVHPELDDLAAYRTADESVGPGPLFFSRMMLDPGAATLSANGTTNGRPLLPGLSPAQLRRAAFVTHFPGFLVSFKTDGVTLFWYWPDGAGRTHVVQEFLFPAPVVDDGMDISDAVEFTARVAEQDWAVCAKVQRGLASRGYRGGIFSDIEGRAHVFDKFMALVYLTGERPLHHDFRIRPLAEKNADPPGGGLRQKRSVAAR